MYKLLKCVYYMNGVKDMIWKSYFVNLVIMYKCSIRIINMIEFIFIYLVFFLLEFILVLLIYNLFNIKWWWFICICEN